MDSTRPPKVCCGICNKINQQMPDWIEIWETWRPSQHLELVLVLLKPFLNHFLLRARVHYLDANCCIVCSIGPYRPASLSMCVSESWLSMTLSLVCQCSFLGSLLLNTDQCRPGTRNKISCSGETQSSSHHNLALDNSNP